MNAIVIGQTLRCAPFAVLLTAGIALGGWITGAWHANVSPSVIQHWGFAPSYLWQGHPWTFVTANFLTNRPLMFWGILPFAALVVGTYEWYFGTGRTLFAFWVGGLTAELGAAVLAGLPLTLAGSPAADDFIRTADVGMSAGGFICLGGLIVRLPRRYWFWTVAAVYIFIAIKMLFRLEPSSDLIHILALPIGFLLARWYWRKPARSHPV